MTAEPRRAGTAVTWRLVVGIELVVALALRMAVFARPLPALDRIFVPDDTYYTLSIARSLGHLHGPSADGHTLTSGFQPLIAFVVAPVFQITGNPDLALRFDMAFLLLCDVGIVLLLAWIGRRLAGNVAGMVAAGIWAVSPAAVRLALGGLETTLAMFAELGLVACWLWASDRPSSRRGALLGVIAALAVLARVDAMALVGLVAVAILWRGPRRLLVPAAIAGALVLAPWWGYCLVQFGSPIPASGSAARALQPGGAWSSLTTSASSGALVNGPFAVWSSVGGWFGEHRTTWPYWTGLALATGAAIGCAVRAVRRPAPVGAGPSAAVPAAVLAAFAALLIAFYGWFNVAYYVTRYLGPVIAIETLLIGAVVGSLTRWALDRWDREPRPRIPAGAWAGLTVVLLGLGGLLLARPLWASSIADASGARYEAATGYRPQARLTDRVVPRGATIGAAQSGALAYYAGERHPVVNLDGVVDPDAAAARRRGELGTYLLRRDVTWLADWSFNTVDLANQARRADPSARFVVTRRVQFDGQPEFFIARRR